VFYGIHFLFENSCFPFCNFVFEIWYKRARSPRTLMISMKLEPPSDDQLDSAYNSGGRPEQSDE